MVQLYFFYYYQYEFSFHFFCYFYFIFRIHEGKWMRIHADPDPQPWLLLHILTISILLSSWSLKEYKFSRAKKHSGPFLPALHLLLAGGHPWSARQVAGHRQGGGGGTPPARGPWGCPGRTGAAPPHHSHPGSPPPVANQLYEEEKTD